MKLVRYIAKSSTGPAVGILDGETISEAVSYTHLTLPTNREV